VIKALLMMMEVLMMDQPERVDRIMDQKRNLPDLKFNHGSSFMRRAAF
jgi:hypothetical protein